MIRLCFSLFLLLLFLSQSTAQKKDKDILTGIWYAKTPVYKFPQDGSASIYTKAMVNNFKQKLVIEKDSSYTYFETAGNDTIFVSGKISISSDTMIFKLDSTNHVKYKYYTVLKYYLYYLDKAQLIYSFSPFPINPQLKNDASVFRPVETEPYYTDGKHAFFKLLYSHLASGKAANIDSVYLNSYSLTVNAEGGFNIATLNELNARSEYLAGIKKSLQKVVFSPATQNGKNVMGRMTFKVTY